MQKSAITSVAIQETIANRWSPRAFDASKSVSQEQIIALLEAARWAPSCFGDEPWRFIVWNKGTNESAWQQAFDCLVPGNQAWVIHAPILVLSITNTLFNHNGKPNRFAQYDTGAATENLCLQAASFTGRPTMVSSSPSKRAIRNSALMEPVIYSPILAERISNWSKKKTENGF